MSITSLPTEHGGHTAGDSTAGTRRWTATALSPRLGRLVAGSLFPAADIVALTAVLSWHAELLFGVIYAIGVLIALSVADVYRVRLCWRVWDQIPRIAVAATVPMVILLPWMPPGRALLLALSVTGTVAASRGIAAALQRRLHRSGHLRHPTLIVGTGDLGGNLADQLCTKPEFGLVPRGFLESQPSSGHRGLSVLGSPADLAEVVERYEITKVVVCFPANSDSELVPVLRHCRSLPVDVWLVPRCYELGMAIPRSSLDEIWGVPLIPLRRNGITPAVIKRLFDVVAGGVLLVAFGPVLLGLALIARFSTGHASLFRQLRVTRDAKSTRVIKLRTVRNGVRPGWAVRAEHCTRFGRWLRQTHLDELPQLLTVVRGDMSLVGPRPERPHYAVRFAREIPRYADRHRVRGGMTGWAQVNGLHGDTSISDRARFDNHYIEYWSLWWDVVIVAKTAAIVALAAVRSLRAGGR